MVAIVCLVLPLFVANAQAQDGTIEGTVTDMETGEPLPGSSVLLEETGQGVATDVDGEFEISGIEPGTYTVSVSFVGYEEHTEEVDVVADEVVTLNVELAAEEHALDELVVTGYAVQPRREVTGAISTVSGEDFRVRNIQTPDQAIQGRSVGVQMVGGSGAPGAQNLVRIRGTGSIEAGNDPLYIVDGVQLESDQLATQGGGNILAGLNPRDIESIEILRDAEATAIYGAQGANGVVLITTRRGAEGATRFTASAQSGVAQQVNFYPIVEAPQWAEFMMEAYGNRAELQGLPREDGYQEAMATYGDPAEVTHTDWQDAMHQLGTQTRVDLSASGGTDATQFYLSGGYHDHQGTALGTYNERISFRANLDHQATDRLTFESNINLARNQGSGVAEHGNFINAPFHGGVSTRPTSPVFDDDHPSGYFQGDPVGYNLVQLLREQERTGRTLQAIGNLAAMYQITSQLNVRTSWGLDYRVVRDRDHRPATIPGYAATDGSLSEITREVINWTGNVVGNYNQTFDEVHNVSGLVGVELRDMFRDTHQSVGEGFPNPAFRTQNLTAVPASVGGARTEYSTMGVFSRLQYNYDQRYFLSGSIRTDGHSRFGADRRWGVFYSGALAWDLAQEGFMEGIEWVDQLRPRISYGITGNSDIGNFASRGLFGEGGTYFGSGGIRPNQLANPQLTWEQAETADLSLDYSLFQGRIFGEVAVFRNHNRSLLLDRFLPIESGYDAITENVGTVRNEGLELQIGAVPLDIGEFTWRTDFNITFQRSEITELAEDQETVTSTVRLGYPRQIWWGIEYVGVNPADGRPLYLDENDNLTHNPGEAANRQIGSPEPDYFGGFSNRFTYGPVSLEGFFQFEMGADVQDVTYHAFLLAPWRGRALHADVLERWQEPGDVTWMPMAFPDQEIQGARNHTAVSSLRMQDGSYIRLKSLTLSYDLPGRFAAAMGLENMTVFAQGENLLTWTTFSGVDPELVNVNAGDRSNQAIYPQPQSFTGGIEVTF